MLGAEGEREREARASAEAFLAAPRTLEIVVHGFRDGFLPYDGGEVKDVFEELKAASSPISSSRTRGRPAPGSPPRLRADLEHVPRTT